MSRIVKAAAVTLLSTALAIVGLPLVGGGATPQGSTGCCRTAL